MNDATERINEMINSLRGAIKIIDRKMIKEWVEDLVLEKTFIGLRFQEAILKKIADIKKVGYRLSNPEEESKGIDGFIDNIPVSIKPETYKIKDSLREEIKTKIIFYKKTKSGLEINGNQVFEK